MNQVSSLSQFTRLSQPLTVGDVVSVGLAITKQRWGLFCGISLRAIAWMVLPILAMIILIGLGQASTSGIRNSRDPDMGLLVIGWVIWVVGFLYCFGKYLANAGLISRITFNELTQREETVKEAARVTRSLTWSYLGASLIYGVIFIAAIFGLGILLTFAIAIVSLIVGSIANFGGLSTRLLFGTIGAILFLLCFLGYVAGLTWVMGRFFFSEVPLSVEPKIGGAGAIGRSWDLSQKSGFRLLNILTVGFLITIPITALGQVITFLPLLLIRSGEDADVTSSAVQFLSGLLNLISTLVITLLTMGFWQSVKAVVYFDLLNSREGKALKLHD